MIINNREVSFFYTLGASFEYAKLAKANPDLTVDQGNAELAVILNKAWHKAHPEDKSGELTMEELEALPYGVYSELVKEVVIAVKRDSETTVETDTKRKNAKSAAKK